MYIFYDPISPSTDRRRVILLMNVMTIYDICLFLFFVADEVKETSFSYRRLQTRWRGGGRILSLGGKFGACDDLRSNYTTGLVIRGFLIKRTTNR
jgi:hypothetical protein